jgi:hypothetical protein
MVRLYAEKCVSQVPILQAWAGTPGVAMVVRDGPESHGRSSAYSRKVIFVVDVGPEAEEKILEPVQRHRTWITHMHILLHNPYPKMLHHLNQMTILSRERKEAWPILALLPMAQA